MIPTVSLLKLSKEHGRFAILFPLTHFSLTSSDLLNFHQVVVLVELGSESNPNHANVAKVKFTVRTSGQYKISVMIGSTHIAGSPFVRNFLPGPIDPMKSRLVRPANTAVCCASAATMLYIEPRDEFGNGCTFERDFDAIHVRQFDQRLLLIEFYSSFSR